MLLRFLEYPNLVLSRLLSWKAKNERQRRNKRLVYHGEGTTIAFGRLFSSRSYAHLRWFHFLDGDFVNLGNGGFLGRLFLRLGFGHGQGRQLLAFLLDLFGLLLLGLSSGGRLFSSTAHFFELFHVLIRKTKAIIGNVTHVKTSKTICQRYFFYHFFFFRFSPTLHVCLRRITHITIPDIFLGGD